MGTYVSEEDIENLTQLTFTTTSKPTSAHVNQIISEVEAKIIDRQLGVHRATNEYIDVPWGTEGKGVYNWVYDSDTDNIQFGESLKGAIVPLTNIRRPLIQIITLEKNDEAYTNTPSWEALTEGPADGADYLLLTGGPKQNGYAIVFVDNSPVSGPKRLRVTYDYGHNINSEILKTYCKKYVGIDVLQERMGTSSTDQLGYLDAGGFGLAMNQRYVERIDQWKADITDIEERHFPKDAQKGGVAFVVM